MRKQKAAVGAEELLHVFCVIGARPAVLTLGDPSGNGDSGSQHHS